MVAAARVYGLEAGTRARPTRERLEAAIEAGVVSRDLGQTLIETYRFLLQLRLREQLAAVAGGGAPDNDVNFKALSSLQRRHLKDAFGVIREMQGASRGGIGRARWGKPAQSLFPFTRPRRMLRIPWQTPAR
ncbi:MAG: hypothetical protein IPH48_18270 [bacterium]|nr:hypothetical protein [bacterium]